jgi:predicted site-specific integrase-resolvase
MKDALGAEREVAFMNPFLTQDVVEYLHAQNVPRSAASVRLYEKQGLLPATRTASGTRLFKKEDVEKLAQKLKAQEARS